jgi:hypothetical protein
MFAIDIERCCGGRLRVIASIEEPALIERILVHLEQHGEADEPARPPLRPALRRSRRCSEIRPSCATLCEPRARVAT